MAATRRGKSQARRTSGNGVPGWVWLVAGMALAAVLFLAWPALVKKNGDGFLRPRPNPDALPQQANTADAEAADTPAVTAPPPTAAPAKPTQYDFYTLLPGKEVQMSDAELAASARAEQAAQARARKAADLLAGGNGDGRAL
ncbi:MAG: sporulation protein, partial [Pseudoxanthomonas sp.]